MSSLVEWEDWFLDQYFSGPADSFVEEGEVEGDGVQLDLPLAALASVEPHSER